MTLSDIGRVAAIAEKASSAVIDSCSSAREDRHELALRDIPYIEDGQVIG